MLKMVRSYPVCVLQHDSNNESGSYIKHICLQSQMLSSLIKEVPLQAWSEPEGSRKLRFPDFMTTAQDGGKV
jgi:hypothetical protein